MSWVFIRFLGFSFVTRFRVFMFWRERDRREMGRSRGRVCSKVIERVKVIDVYM